MRLTVMLAMAALALAARAQSVAVARQLMDNGEYPEALEALNHLPAKEARTAQPYNMKGECYLAMGDDTKALAAFRQAVDKGSNDAYLEIALIDIKRYNIAHAEAQLESYRNGLKKGRRTLPDESGEVVAKLERMRNLLNRVEQIVVFDSINVPAENFFKYYRLNPECGTLNTARVLPGDFPRADETEVFIPENRGEMIWSAPDDSLNYNLVHSLALYGNQWDKPVELGAALSLGGDANYPFLMPDGITLYYASDGEGTIGGYDIYISRRDAGGFLQPQNVGMPYNSPYNDYMLAIDEITGVGWWASDRTQLEDSVTIYMFIPSETRHNINVEDPQLQARAMVRDITKTWEPGADYTDLKERIATIEGPERELQQQCSFTLPDGRTITRIEQLSNPDARRALRQYIELYNEVLKTRARLDSLRQTYAQGNTAVASDILSLEHDIERDRITLQHLSNEVIAYQTQQ